MTALFSHVPSKGPSLSQAYPQGHRFHKAFPSELQTSMPHAPNPVLVIANAAQSRRFGFGWMFSLPNVDAGPHLIPFLYATKAPCTTLNTKQMASQYLLDCVD